MATYGLSLQNLSLFNPAARNRPSAELQGRAPDETRQGLQFDEDAIGGHMLKLALFGSNFCRK